MITKRLSALILLSITLTSCTLWNKYVNKSDPPECSADTPLGVVAIEPEREVTRILIYGDGLGTDRSEAIARQARKTCDELGGCHFGLYVGDIYESGANTKKQLDKKVLSVMENFNFHTYMSLGNHEYYGDVPAYYKLLKSADANKERKARLPCNQYLISDGSSYTFRIVDTNHPEQAGQAQAMAKLCDEQSKGHFTGFVGHHGLWSSSTKKRSDEEEATRKHFEKVMRECGDVYFAGHDHHGEILRSTTDDGTIVQVIEGRFGRKTRSVINSGIENQLWISDGYGFAIFEVPLNVKPIDKPYLMMFNDKGNLLYPFVF